MIEDINVRNHIDRRGQVFFDREKDAPPFLKSVITGEA
ncbi:hypothetical protein TPY_3569 [Sulfobacillus acidophilus TPY]|nr:hypothetical protein TPY_3569 [Sulfobacillus acidophilus TPY]